MTAAPSAPPSFWTLSRSEPFRIFFPLGVLAAVSGVSLWPLYFSGLHRFYPGVMHARLMIEGFMAAFVIGFLGTAGPRLTDAAPLSKREFWSLLALWVSTAGTQIAERYAAADGLFLILLIVFAAALIPRFLRSADLPPPSFVLVGFGLANAFIGAALVFAGEAGWASGYGMLLGMDMLHQGFVLNVLLGVGGFLLPRFLEISPEADPASDGGNRREWNARAIRAGLIGAVITGSFVFEVFGEAPRLAALLRFGVVAGFLLFEVEILRASRKCGTLARWLGVSLLLLLAGLAFPLFWPWQRAAGLHMIFIGAFSLGALAVATRVVLGHSGRLGDARSPLPLFTAVAGLLIAGMVLRVLGDFLPATRGRLLSIAANSWMAGAALWGVWVLPNIRRADPG